MAEPRCLRGHTGTASCCIASRERPGVVATGGEDGCVCLYDLRCKDMLLSMNVADGSAVSSLCFKPGNEDSIYISAGNEIKCFQMCMPSSYEKLHIFSYNKDEINQVVHHPKSSFLAAADDSGDVKIIDAQQRCLYKTLRAGHNNICSSVQFLPWRSWEAITGGFDSRLLIWDFSTGRSKILMDFGIRSDASQLYNPAFVHALAVPNPDMSNEIGKVCAVARGDGIISVIDIGSENASTKSTSSSKLKSYSKSTSNASSPSPDSQNARNQQFDFSMGGHLSAASCVAFSLFGSKRKLLISGGNDRAIKVWDWCKAYDCGSAAETLRSEICLRRKVNSICTTPSDTENLVVCDTSKVVKVYTVG